jgi:hypothetical protein
MSSRVQELQELMHCSDMAGRLESVSTTTSGLEQVVKRLQHDFSSIQNVPEIGKSALGLREELMVPDGRKATPIQSVQSQKQLSQTAGSTHQHSEHSATAPHSLTRATEQKDCEDGVDDASSLVNVDIVWRPPHLKESMDYQPQPEPGTIFSRRSSSSLAVSSHLMHLQESCGQQLGSQGPERSATDMLVSACREYMAPRQEGAGAQDTKSMYGASVADQDESGAEPHPHVVLGVQVHDDKNHRAENPRATPDGQQANQHGWLRGFGLLQIANATAYFANCFIVNTSVLGWYGATNSEMSAKYSTFVTPAGAAFSIWGLVYVLEGVFTVYTLLPSQRSPSNPLVRCIGPWWVAVQAMQIAWTIFFAQDVQWGAYMAMLSIYLGLLVIVIRLDIGRYILSPTSYAPKPAA